MDKKLIDSAEAEAEVFPWGQIKWLHAGRLTGTAGLTVGEVIINPGMENGLHSHPNCEEVLYLVEGELIHTCGSEGPFPMKPGVSIRVPQNVKHNARCVSDVPARMIISFSSAYRMVDNE